MIDFTDKRYRSDFKAERDRLLAAIRDCEVMDRNLNQSHTELSVNMQRTRGAASLVVRLSEQIIANRNHRLALIKELRILKRDVLEREIRLAEKAEEAAAGVAQRGVSAELLTYLQNAILLPGSGAAILEPGTPVAAPSEAASALELPDDIAVGDTVCDPDGNLWVIGERGAEETGLQAVDWEVEPAEGVPYGILEDGSYVLMVTLE